MRYSIRHELPGRIRLRNEQYRFTLPESRIVCALLEMQDGVRAVSVSHRTGSILLCYDTAAPDARDKLLAAVALIDREFYSEINPADFTGEEPPSLLRSLLQFAFGIALRSLLPAFVRQPLALVRALPVLKAGTASFMRSGLTTVSVLDASAIGVSLLQRDFQTAAIITSLLRLGDILEDWTRKKSKESLTQSLLIHVDKIWVRSGGGQEVQIPASELTLGDVAVIRSGSVIPVDGVIVDGEAMVNQSSLTGEAVPIHRSAGLTVYAGTVVEEEVLAIRVTAFDSDPRIQKIAKMIEESEALKANIQNRAERMASAMVPYNFLLAGAVLLCTRSVVKASSALLVDYSCAIKLATPLAIFSAMREAAQHGVLIKGGKYLEAIHEADTFVFDKTGTLTFATPKLVKVVPFKGYEEKQILRIAACFEEHFPHSIARAIVKTAEEASLDHREEHTEVEYIMTHGITSLLHSERVLIGSGHFVFEDEHVPCTEEQRRVIEAESGNYSTLYLAYKGELAGIFCIEDPLREEARDVIRELRRDGVSRIVMLTGDNERSARQAASLCGIDEFHAQLLPEDKTHIINEMKQKGAKVAMIGDGINDSPSLAAADVGISMKSGADIAQEVADIVLTDNRLAAIADARRIGDGALKKISSNYAFIVGTNTLLIMLGLGGLITPALSAFLHNMTTIGASVYSLASVCKEKDEKRLRL